MWSCPCQWCCCTHRPYQLFQPAAFSIASSLAANPRLQRAIPPDEARPSGRFAANGAWLAVQVIAHNLARWTARLGLGEGIVTTRTLRRRLFSLPGRLTRSARRLTLHLPERWPWAGALTDALTRLRALPLPT